MDITVYCSVDNDKLHNVASGEDYLVPFPENNKHPEVLSSFLYSLLTSVETSGYGENVTILTHSDKTLNIVINWLEDHKTLDHTNFKVVILMEEEEQVATLYEDDGEYYLENWQVGFFSLPWRNK